MFYVFVYSFFYNASPPLTILILLKVVKVDKQIPKILEFFSEISKVFKYFHTLPEWFLRKLINSFKTIASFFNISELTLKDHENISMFTVKHEGRNWGLRLLELLWDIGEYCIEGKVWNWGRYRILRPSQPGWLLYLWATQLLITSIQILAGLSYDSISQRPCKKRRNGLFLYWFNSQRFRISIFFAIPAVS